MQHLRFSILLLSLAMQAGADTMACVSNGDFETCRLDNATQRHVTLQSQKAGTCTPGTGWGVDTNDIWVNNGCSGIFEYDVAGSSPATSDTTTNSTTHNTEVIPAPYIGPDYMADPGAVYIGGEGYCSGYGCGGYDNEPRKNANAAANNAAARNAEENFGREYDHMGGFHGGGFHGGGGGRR